MERPDAALVRSILPNIDWEGRGYPLPAEPVSDDNPDPLQFLVDAAIDWVEDTTGRALDATMPVPLTRMAQLAVALATVSLAADLNGEQIDALIAAGTLQSFSADGYSETYRSEGQAFGRGTTQGAPVVHPWPLLNRLLWALMTPEKRMWWRAFLEGGGIPSYGIAQIDWSGQNRYGGIPGAVGGGGIAGDELGSGSYSDIPPSNYPMPDGPLD